MGTFPQYEYPHALARYAEIGRYVGLTGKDDQEVFDKLIAKLEDLKKAIEIKPSIQAYGVDEKYFFDTLDAMTEQAFNDQCTGANPRYPLMPEMKEIYTKISSITVYITHKEANSHLRSSPLCVLKKYYIIQRDRKTRRAYLIFRVLSLQFMMDASDDNFYVCFGHLAGDKHEVLPHLSAV